VDKLVRKSFRIECTIIYSAIILLKESTMTPELEAAYYALPQLSQRQDGNLDQLADLFPLAGKLGLTQASGIVGKLLDDRRDLDPDSSYATAFPQKTLEDALFSVTQLAPSGASERQELYYLRAFANRLGLQDAADTLRVLAEKPNKLKP
jgi:hypothetical protein